MARICTPDTSHLTADRFHHIYEPAEDSFLLIDAIELELPWLVSTLKPAHCLEMGCGSGVVITACACALGHSCRFYGVDINPEACRATGQTARKNGVEVDTFCGNLDTPIPDSLRGRLDLLIFNPPYVETDSAEVGSGDLEYTWAGGQNGREVIDKFLPIVPQLLSQKGVFYLLLEKLNLPQEIVTTMKEYNFKASEIIARKTGPEHLTVFKFSRITC